MGSRYVLANLIQHELGRGRAAASTLGCQAARPETVLTFAGLKYAPGERVAGFDIKIAGGQVVGLPRVPVGDWVYRSL